MRNKFATLLLFVAILVNIGTVSAFAETVPTVTVGSVTGKVGTTVEIPISISGNMGFANLAIEIDYDKTALKLMKVTGSTGTEAFFTTAQDYTVSPYNMIWDSADNVMYNGILAIMTFDVMKEGTYPVTVEYYKGRNGNYVDGNDINYDENFNPIGLKYANGIVTISESEKDPTISVVQTGTASFDITLDATDYSGSVIAAIYSNSGELKSFKTYKAEKALDVSFDEAENEGYVKIMWWENINSMLPVCESQILLLR